MTIMWIRHGKKKYKNGKAIDGGREHDPGLINSLEEIHTLCKIIKKKYGCPDMIITSPFLRTRQTAGLIQTYFGDSIPIHIDTDITEFLGWVKPRGNVADIDEVTKSFITPLLGVENVNDVQLRVNKHLTKINLNVTDSMNVIVVTHGIIIKYIYKIITGNTINQIKELGGVTINKGVLTTV